MKLRFALLLISLLFVYSNILSQSQGGITSGTSDYCNSTNSGFISLTAYTGTIVQWETSTNNGGTWIAILNPTATQSYNNISVTTWYRVIVQDGAFPPDTSTISIITIHPPAIGGTISGGGIFCASSGNGVLTISGSQGNVDYWETSIDNGFTWLTVANTSVSYNYSAISENTLIRAIVSNIATCPSDTTNTVSFQIDAQTNPGTLSQSDTICNGANQDTITLNNYVGVITKWENSINNGTTWSLFSYLNDSLEYTNLTSSIWYRVTVKNGICNSLESNIVKLTTVNPQIANAGDDKTIIQYKETTLAGGGNGSAQWSPTDGLSSASQFQPTASPYATTTYTLTLTDNHGCITKDSVTITVIVPIPSAFTPNNDGVNDVFIIDKINDYPTNSLSITNRWGMEVYNAAPYKNTWIGTNNNGKDLPDDIYYYTFDYGDGKKEIASGFILIKR